jgi:hypothetical protein
MAILVFTFHPLRISCQFIFTQQMSSSCITALKTILPDVQILNISEFLMGPGKYSSPTTVLFMQGSVSWLRNLWHVLEVFPQVMISVSSGSIGQLNPFWHCHRIPSIDTGCVIDGIWNFCVKGLKTTFKYCSYVSLLSDSHH